jgi:hypothetical protein
MVNEAIMKVKILSGKDEGLIGEVKSELYNGVKHGITVWKVDFKDHIGYYYDKQCKEVK